MIEYKTKNVIIWQSSHNEDELNRKTSISLIVPCERYKHIEKNKQAMLLQLFFFFCSFCQNIYMLNIDSTKHTKNKQRNDAMILCIFKAVMKSSIYISVDSNPFIDLMLLRERKKRWTTCDAMEKKQFNMHIEVHIDIDKWPSAL